MSADRGERETTNWARAGQHQGPRRDKQDSAIYAYKHGRVPMPKYAQYSSTFKPGDPLIRVPSCCMVRKMLKHPPDTNMLHMYVCTHVKRALFSRDEKLVAFERFFFFYILVVSGTAVVTGYVCTPFHRRPTFTRLHFFNKQIYIKCKRLVYMYVFRTTGRGGAYRASSTLAGSL